MHPATWLFAAALFTELTGLSLVAAALIPGSLDPIISLVFADPVALDAPGRLGTGIAGAVMAGWASSLAVLAKHVHSLSPSVLGTATMWGAGVWFVTDGIVSVTNGAALNLVGNLLYLAILMIPAYALRNTANIEPGRALT